MSTRPPPLWLWYVVLLCGYSVVVLYVLGVWL